MLPIKQLVENLSNGKLQIDDFLDAILANKPYMEVPKYALKVLARVFITQNSAYVNTLIKVQQERDSYLRKCNTLTTLIKEIPNVKGVDIRCIQDIQDISSISSSIPRYVSTNKQRIMTITIEVNL
jgi:hypothetical protein